MTGQPTDGRIEAKVRWDRRQGRPRSVHWGRRRLSVLRVAAQRDELAAYPADGSPRVTLLVETDYGPASLVFDGRQRRWYLEVGSRAA